MNTRPFHFFSLPSESYKIYMFYLGHLTNDSCISYYNYGGRWLPIHFHELSTTIAYNTKKVHYNSGGQ
jgi:hypothetical protein